MVFAGKDKTALAAALTAAITAAMIALVSLAGASTASAASTQERIGGLTVPARPSLKGVECLKKCVSPRRATPGAVVRFTGTYLDGVKKVVFPGKKDPVSSRYIARTGRAVRVEVPRGADDGRPYAVDSSGNRSNRVPGTLEILPASAIPVEVFPVDGPVDFGSSGARFGAGRAGHSHQGQDVIASCGLPVLASRRGRVVYNEYHSLAGNYVVIKNAGSNTYFAYMHLTRPSKLKVGKVYDAGRKIGRVGDTGDAAGCHLHFEYWVGPWQTGGRPIDPLPFLKSVR